jgi:hypothetical protein
MWASGMRLRAGAFIAAVAGVFVGAVVNPSPASLTTSFLQIEDARIMASFR